MQPRAFSCGRTAVFSICSAIEHPIVLAPMAGAIDFEIAAAVAEAGGLGSLPCAMLNAEQAREQIAKFRARTASRSTSTSSATRRRS